MSFVPDSLMPATLYLIALALVNVKSEAVRVSDRLSVIRNSWIPNQGRSVCRPVGSKSPPEDDGSTRAAV